MKRKGAHSCRVSILLPLSEQNMRDEARTRLLTSIPGFPSGPSGPALPGSPLGPLETEVGQILARQQELEGSKVKEEKALTGGPGFPGGPLSPCKIQVGESKPWLMLPKMGPHRP